MIWGRWKEPNRQVTALDPDGGTIRKWITYAPDNSDDALLQRLERQGYSRIQISIYDFQKWKNRAREAARRASESILANRKPVFNPAIYGALKQHLFDLSGGRCAYCEAVVKHVDYGDVEHYRPKAAVRDDPRHTGYYWLAYEPTNLLPSCGLCNKPPGKQDQFPVCAGTRVSVPGSPIENEQPLLLNPYMSDPRDHLRFLMTGDVEGKTEEGKQTIAICRLRRPREQRRKAMDTLEKNLEVRRAANGGHFDAAIQSLLEDLLKGQDEYCNALLDHLLYLIDEEGERLARARKIAQGALNPGAI